MSRAGYRASCYNCIYATPQKPADITLGDYHLKDNEYEQYQLLSNNIYSTILVHNNKGEKMFDAIKDKLIIALANSKEVIARHGNLNHPSKMTDYGRLMYSTYLQGGYAKLQRMINIRFLKSNFRYYLTYPIHSLFNYKRNK